MSAYTVDYFIEKFEEIPEHMWIIRTFRDPFCRCCAYGFCGVGESSKTTEEAKQLQKLFSEEMLLVTTINDCETQQFPQPTPKQRILAALNYIKNKTT